jgi:hypothetical protein
VRAVDVLREARRVVDGALVGPALSEAQPGVDRVAKLRLILFGDAEEHSDHAHRHLRPEVRDEIDGAAADQRIEASRAVGPNPGLELRDAAGREHARQQGTMGVVKRRVLEYRTGRKLDVVADQLERRARAELWVPQS